MQITSLAEHAIATEDRGLIESRHHHDMKQAVYHQIYAILVALKQSLRRNHCFVPPSLKLPLCR